jgi:hypothetical protein
MSETGFQVLRKNLRRTFQRLRENLTGGEPILPLRETIRGEASTHPKYESTIEYDTVKTFKTQDGRTIRVYYLNDKPVHIEELEEPIEGVGSQKAQEPVESSHVEVETPLPSRLVKRERPRLIEGPLRKYIDSVVRERELETQYQELRLQHFKRVLESPPPSKTKQSESETREGSKY